MKTRDVYQTFRLDTDKVDTNGNSAGLSQSAKNFSAASNLRTKLVAKGYEVRASDETYQSLPKLIMLEVSGNYTETGRITRKMQNDFLKDNEDDLPYEPDASFTCQDYKSERPRKSPAKAMPRPRKRKNK